MARSLKRPCARFHSQLWLSRHEFSQACLLQSISKRWVFDFHHPSKKNWGGMVNDRSLANIEFPWISKMHTQKSIAYVCWSLITLDFFHHVTCPGMSQIYNSRAQVTWRLLKPGYMNRSTMLIEPTTNLKNVNPWYVKPPVRTQVVPHERNTMCHFRYL